MGAGWRPEILPPIFCQVLKRKKPGTRPGKVEVRQKVKTFQRERPTRQRREEESGAALKSAKVHIGRIQLICNATCLMKGLRLAHASCQKADMIRAAMSLAMD
jgi:hypothetical protein